MRHHQIKQLPGKLQTYICSATLPYLHAEMNKTGVGVTVSHPELITAYSATAQPRQGKHTCLCSTLVQGSHQTRHIQQVSGQVSRVFNNKMRHLSVPGKRR